MTLSVQPTEIGALIVGSIGAWTSWKTNKLYNWLTFPAAAVGIALNGIVNGQEAGLAAFITWLGFAIVLTGVRFVLPKNAMWLLMPFGTVKLLAALASFLGAIQSAVIVFLFLLVSCVFWYTKYARSSSESSSVRSKEVLPHGPIILVATFISMLLFHFVS